MAFKVPDFKDSVGDWVYRYTEEDAARYSTRSGMLYHALIRGFNGIRSFDYRLKELNCNRHTL